MKCRECPNRVNNYVLGQCETCNQPTLGKRKFCIRCAESKGICEVCGKELHCPPKQALSDS